MEKYSKAVSEMYSQFKKKEAHPMEKYIGKHADYLGCEEEVVGYTTWPDDFVQSDCKFLTKGRLDRVRAVRRHTQKVRKILVC